MLDDRYSRVDQNKLVDQYRLARILALLDGSFGEISDEALL